MILLGTGLGAFCKGTVLSPYRCWLVLLASSAFGSARLVTRVDRLTLKSSSIVQPMYACAQAVVGPRACHVTALKSSSPLTTAGLSCVFKESAGLVGRLTLPLWSNVCSSYIILFPLKL